MRTLILLALLAATAPALRAQEVEIAPVQLAQIEPAARDLLARTQARYQKFESFESLIFWKIGAAGQGLGPRRFRVQMTIDGKFVAGEEFADKSWRKAICDGKNLVEFRSKYPKTYTRKSIVSPLYFRLAPQLEASLRDVGAEGPLISLMLTQDFGAALLDPAFDSLNVRDEGNLKVVEMSSRVPAGFTDAGTVEAIQFWIEPQTLTLDHVTLLSRGAEVFTESYAQTRFNPQFDAALFRAAAPLNYKLVSYFPDEVVTVSNPPQEFATP